jgi:hypothetical protein
MMPLAVIVLMNNVLIRSVKIFVLGRVITMEKWRAIKVADDKASCSVYVMKGES